MGDSSDRILRITKSCNVAAGVIEPCGSENENYVLGGVLSNPKLSWISCGPRLTALNNDDGSKRTGWTFGWALGDPSYKVTCVEELTISASGSPILIVACESETAGSTLCFYHSGSSRVLKAIHFNDKITSLAVISRHNSSEENIATLLKSWSGICAVGSGSGKVYLIDICWSGLQKYIEDYRQRLFDEHRQSKLLELSIQDVLDHGDWRNNNVKQGSSTLSLWLNEETLQNAMSEAHPGVQNILGRMPREFLSVSALKYLPQIGTLAVGYNTSCFQLWDLTTLSILYTSALLEAMLPVYSFTLLEPSDDPKYVCYLWSMHHSDDEDNIPFAGMYILSFHEKYLNDYTMQTVYQGFSSCSIRYQLDLGIEIDNAVGGRIISCQSIHRSSLKPSPAWLHTSEENVLEEGSTASLLAIAWEVWTPNQLGLFTKLTVFDLHQWYREYMPQSSHGGCARFMTHFTLPDGPLLDLKVIPSSIRQFVTLQPADEHFYPSAMTFDCLCLQQSSVLHCSHVGLQLECLQALQDGGPSALLLPSRLYKMCSSAGIRPLLAEHGSPSAPHSKEQREYLLSLALEFEMVQYLRNCVRDWCDGSHAVAGCTLPALLQWAWGRVERYKKWLDRMREPLFDNSGAALDTNDMGIFQHVICQLHRLYDIYKLVLEKYRNCIIIGNYEHQYNAISLVKVFYDSILWCVRNSVLPETNSVYNNSNHIIPYMADKIVNATISRRADLHHLAKSLRHAVPTGGLFLVDVVIAQEAGSRLTEQWEREGGQVTAGKYPPPSVQSLLRTYLVRGIPSHVKHFIVGYFLLDVLYAVDAHSFRVSEEIRQKLTDYPSDFGLSESQSKIVQAFWHLDHKEFEEGVNLLLDGSIEREDLKLYHHRTIICLLVASSKPKLALHYLNIRNPGLVDADDIKLNMTLLLVNDLIHEAFDFQRHHKALRNELLDQFFTGCVEMKKIDVVFKLPLNTEEEEAFMAFLEKTSHPQADDLKVFYLLSRSRYIEAIDMNKKLGSSKVSHRGTEGMPLGYSPLGPRSRNLFGPRADSGVPAKVVLTTRDLIINSVAKSLPSVTRELTDYCSKEKSFNWKRVNRPTPLSVVVHTEINNERLPFYKAADSAVVQAALSKTRETWAPLLATPAALKRKHCSTVEDTPFLRTPIHSRFNFSTFKTTPPNGIRSGVRWRTDDEDCITKSVKRARLEYPQSAEKETRKTDCMTSLKTVDMELTSAESLALLHTPFVTRVVKQKPSRETTTPHSILKGSAANTPNTPSRMDKSLVPGVSRQIRFSLPLEDSSPSSPSVMDEDEEHQSPAVSPRKSIHQLSSVKERRGTPANPRLLSQALRNAVIHLQFDDEEPKHLSPQLKRSATATSLLENISTSPVTSNDTFLSFRSSLSSKDSDRGSGENRPSFKLPLGLEGNIETSIENELIELEHDETTLMEDLEKEILSDSEKSAVSTPKVNKMKYPKRPNTRSSLKKEHTLSDVEVLEDDTSDFDQSSEPSSSDGTKTVVIEYSTAPKTPITQKTIIDASLSVDEEESDEEITKKDMKWILEQSENLQERLKLEVHKQSSRGDKSSVTTITLSEEMKMYYSEPTTGTDECITNNTLNIDHPIVNEDKEGNETTFLLEKTQSFSSLKETEKSLLQEDSVDCELVEAEQLPLKKSSSRALKESTMMFSNLSPSRSKKVKAIGKLSLTETLSSSMLDQPEQLFVNTNLPAAEKEESNLSILSESSRVNQTTPLFNSNETPINTEQKGTEHSIVIEPQNKTRDFNTIESKTKNDISINPAVVGPTNIEKDVCSVDMVASQMTENVVVNRDSFQETNNAVETPLPHILDELIQKGRISLSVKESQDTTPKIDVCKENTEESVDTSLLFKQAFASPTSVTLNSNQPSVRWEFGASIVQEKSVSNVETSSQKETENEETVEEDLLINKSYSSENQNELETENANNENLFKASQSISQDVSSEKDSIYTVNEIISEKPPSSVGPKQENCAVIGAELDKPSTNFTFVIESTTSLATAFHEDDPAGDFDLKLSEGDSLVEINSQSINREVCTTEENQGPSYEVLKPVQFQFGMDDLVEDNVETEHFSEEHYDEDDIYGDIIEQKQDSSEKSGSEVHEEEVVCLSSSSDEEPENKANLRKCSSPLHHQTTKSSRPSGLVDETLDYEGSNQTESDGDSNEDSNSTVSDHSSYSTESDFVDSDIDINKSHSVKSYLAYSSESEEETHTRRSWKEQRKEDPNSSEIMGKDKSNTSEDKNKSNTSDDRSTNDTIESPCYELIGQNSPIQIESTHKGLEMITEEPDNIYNKEEDLDNISSIPKQVTQYQQENVILETSITDDQNKEGCQESTEATHIVTTTENKRKLFVERGSILDLKRRRSKRYSSVGNLTENSRKLRRRSISMHDFTSIVIKETKSATSQDHAENEEFSVFDSMNDDEPSCKNCFSDDVPLADPEETDKKIEYEDDNKTADELNNMSSKSSSLFVEFDSRGSTRLSSRADESFMSTSTLDYSPRRGKSIKSRFCSLQDISEETSDRTSFDNSQPVRKSLSAGNLMEIEQFEESHLRQSSSVSRWSEHTKVHETEVGENINCQAVNCSTLLHSNCDNLKTNTKNGGETPKLQKNESIQEEVPEHGDWIHNQCRSPIRTNMTEFDLHSDTSPIVTSSNDSTSISNFQVSNNGNVSKTSFERAHRAKSEPLVPEEPNKRWLPKKRRSSSLLKLQNIDKIISRSSLRRKSSKESLCEPLEVVYSDEEFIDNFVGTSIQNKADTKSISVDVGSKSDVHEESLDKSANRSTQLVGQGDLTEAGPSSPEIRKQRGRSEPPRVMTDTIHKPHLRKSGSYQKIQNLHKLVFRRSLKKLSHAKSYQTLEIIHSSDEDKSFHNDSPGSSPFSSTTDPDNFTTKTADNETLKKDYLSSKASKKRKMDKKRKSEAEIEHKMEGSVTQATSNEEIDDIAIKQLPRKSHRKDKKEDKHLSSMVEDQSSETITITDLNKQTTANEKDINKEKSLQDLETDNILKRSVIDKETNNPNFVQPLKKRGRKTFGNVKQLVQSEEQITTMNENLFKDSKKVKRDLQEQASDELVIPEVSKTKKNKQKASKTISTAKSKSALNEGTESSKAANPVKVSKIVKQALPDQGSSNLDIQEINTVAKKRKASKTTSEVKNKDSSNEAETSKDTEVKAREEIVSKSSRKRKNKKILPQGKTIPNQGEMSGPDKDEISPVTSVSKRDESAESTKDTEIKTKEESVSKNSRKRKTKKSVPEGETSPYQGDSSSTDKEEINSTTSRSIKDAEINTNKEIVSKNSRKQKTKKVLPEVETIPHQEENPTTPVSRRNKTTAKQTSKNAASDLTQPMFDSPAKRTRQSMSRLSDTELLTPTKEMVGLRRSARKSSAMSDILLSTPTSTAYADSEASEASTNVSYSLTTPVRRTRKQSINTPNTPDLVPEEYLSQRRLTRNQHSKLQKSFELSLTESPRVSRLEDLPEESSENEESLSFTPTRSSSRNTNKTLNYSMTNRTHSKTSKN